MTPVLPEAPAHIGAAVLDRLDRFAACLREVDDRAAYPFWHPRLLAFGTLQPVVEGLEKCRDRQWESVWPRTGDLRFRPAAARVPAAGDGSLAGAVADFDSTGCAPDGVAFERPGRATLVPRAGEGEGWLAVHSHASRPVTAR